MNPKHLPIYIFGEVLFDCFPDSEPQLGGAPFNVAWHLQAFGLNPILISAVGDDEPGQQIRQRMSEWGLSQDYLQQDPVHATGQVTVHFEAGEPHYDIVLDSAYDHLDPNELPQPQGDHIFYHGTLAARSISSRECIQQLQEAEDQMRFVDVNLRTPWWDQASVIQQIHAAHCLKLNQDELALLSDCDLSHASLDDCLAVARDFKLQNNIANIILTRGSEGASLLDEEGNHIQPELPTTSAEVVDTVGAGDAFSAITLLGLLNGWDKITTLQRAQDFARYIVTQRGATPSNISVYQDFKCLWGLL